MDIADLPLPKHIIDALLKTEPFTTLNPPQTAVVEAGLFDRKNFLITIPTASGKTFIAELCALQHIISFHKKVIYLTPLKALALEKFHDFKRFNLMGVKAGITLSDFDSSDSKIIEKSDIIISTNEKIDSLLRHNRSIMQADISLLIIDECHLIDDSSRGPTLETLIVKIKKINPSIQLLALSATVSNSVELASWLNASLIQSNWRSVPIKEFFCNQQGFILDRDAKHIRTISRFDILSTLVKETLSDNGQVLIFANSRKTAQSTANALKDSIKDYISDSDRKIISSSISSLRKKNQIVDKTSNSLVDLLKLGIGFHHAGLSNEQRLIVETLFKEGKLKVIVATPTLAAGINLPARRVIISSIWRFSTLNSNMNPIKIMDYEQMRGRSGRPKYDSFGESFVIGSSERDEEVVLGKYFSSKGSEDIESKLSAEPTLRIHLLGVLATGIVNNYTEVKSFLEETFYGFQFNDFERLERNLKKVIESLEKFGFIKGKGEDILITRLGRRVSQLYIDPVTANIIIMGLIKSLSYSDYKPLMFIHLFCLVPDIRRISMKKKEWGKIDVLFEEERGNLLSVEDSNFKFKTENEIESFKTALIIIDWINEVPLPILLKTYDLTLGDFQRLLDTVIWVSYSAKELIKELLAILDEKDVTNFIYIDSLSGTEREDMKYLQKYLLGLHIRISEGIRQDLLEVIELKGLGRVKARTLAKKGIDSRLKLQQAPIEELLSLPGFGPKLVQSLKDQLGQTIEVIGVQSKKANNFNSKSEFTKSHKKTSSLIDFVKK